MTIKNILQQHKEEKELILSKSYIERQILTPPDSVLSSNLIKAIVGPRRAGKSIFSFLLLKSQDFAYVNFDDDDLLKIDNHSEISKGIFETYPQAKTLLLDEVQNLRNWELFVNKLQRSDLNIVVTGSNSKLLSRELAAALTGRHVPIEVLPFSFREFLDARGISIEKEPGTPRTVGNVLANLNEYIKNGGFPEVVVKNIEAKTYLSTLLDSILLKDVVRRYKVRFPEKLYELAIYLVSNFAKEVSFTKLKNILSFNSVNTVQNYLGYLEESYVVCLLNRFSPKLKEQLKTAKKTYVIDNGFITAKAFHLSDDVGRLMESAVFAELLRRGHKPNEGLYYYKTRNQREVDFVVREGLAIKSLIQVCYQTSNDEVLTRESKSLIEAAEELDCREMIIITWDHEGEKNIKNKPVKLIPLWKWLI